MATKLVCGSNKITIKNTGIGEGTTKEDALEDARKDGDSQNAEEYKTLKCPSECQKKDPEDLTVPGLSYDSSEPKYSPPRKGRQKYFCAIERTSSTDIHCGE